MGSWVRRLPAGPVVALGLVVKRSNRVHAAFARANADRLLDVQDENLAVADAAGLRSLANCVDGALDSVIQLFYLRRDKVEVTGTPFDLRQRERAAAIFAWLGKELTDDKAFGLPEISLVCALDWMDFRAAFPTDGLFVALRAASRERPSLASTRPQA